MAHQTPVVRPINWLAVVVQFFFYFLLFLTFRYFFGEKSFTLALIVGVGYSLAIRTVLTIHQRRGMRLIRRQMWTEALPQFTKSFEFFSRHRWLDKWRAVIFLSAAAMTYREMAMANIAFCYTQIGEGQKAKEWYQRTLAEYPNNGLAITALKMMDSFGK